MKSFKLSKGEEYFAALWMVNEGLFIISTVENDDE